MTTARELVSDALANTKDTLTELRDLVRGIRPPALDLGLGPAVQTLAARNPIPVDVTVDLAVRPSIGVETMAYFCVAELLANVSTVTPAQARPPCGSAATSRSSESLVQDNGSGGVQVGNGSGLTGLADRLAMLDGRLEIDSPDGGPTVVDRRGATGSRAVTRIAVAEDSVILREGLAQLLVERGHDVVAKVGTADEMLGAVDEFKPDVFVVDIRMPPTYTDEGLVAAVSLRRSHPDVGVLVFSQWVETRYATELLAGIPRVLAICSRTG